MERKKAGVPRTVYLLGIVSFLTDVSSEMIFPLLPLFITTILGAGAEVLGLIEGVADSAASIIDIFVGYFSDKAGERKKFVILGYGLSAVTKVGIALSTSWWHILIMRGTERIGKSIRTSPRDALIADATPQELRGKSFGLHRAMDTLGAVVGPAIAFIAVSAFHDDYRTVFWLSAIPAFIAVALIVFLVREQKQTRAPKKIAKSVSLKTFALLPKKYRYFVLSTTLFALANFTAAFLLLRANNLGIDATAIPLVYLLYNIVYLLAAMPFGILSDKIGGVRVLAAGYAAFAIASVGLALASNALTAVIFIALFGLFTAANDTMSRVVSVDLAPPKIRASALGLQQALAGAAALPASVIAGVLWVTFSPAAAFAYGACVSLIALAVLAYSFTRK